MKVLHCVVSLPVICCFLGVSSLNVGLEEIQLLPALSGVLPIPVLDGSTLGLLSLNLQKWGAKEAGSGLVLAQQSRNGPPAAEQPFSMNKHSDKMLRSNPFEVHPIRLTSLLYAKGASKLQVIACSVTATLLVAGLLIALWRCCSSETSADTHPDVVKMGDGSWARAYRNSDGEQKDALELLLRCKIISLQEFAHGRASQEHMDECVWIATQMLGQKPLEDWVAGRQQALQSFEDSIAAIFASRTMAQHEHDSANPTEMPWSSRAKGEGLEAPPTPPLQGALKDLWILKGAFSSPLVHSRCGSTASTVPTTPVTPGSMPIHVAESSKSLPFKIDAIDITFGTLDKPVLPEYPRWHLQQDGPPSVLPPPTSEPYFPGSGLGTHPGAAVHLFRPAARVRS